MNIILVGASGKMGRAIYDINKKNVKIIAGVDLIKNEKMQQNYQKFKEIPQKIINNCDILLDFSNPEVIYDELLFCKKYKIPLVICSTGHTNEQLNLINEASKAVPIFKTNNTSWGVYIVVRILRQFSKYFSNYDINIIEKHHRLKKDSPSGTAVMLKDAITENNKNINILSVRGGTVVGEHEILFCGEHEYISIKHVAEDRKLFAYGAIKICEYMRHAKIAKLYSFDDLF